MSERQSQEISSSAVKQQQSSFISGRHRCRSLWLSCSDQVMDRALLANFGLNAALILRPLQPAAPEQSLVSDDHLDLVMAAVQHRPIEQIIVCGHAGCSQFAERNVQSHDNGRPTFEKLILGTCQRMKSNRQGQSRVIEQMRELQQSPFLASAVSQGVLAIHGLFYLAESKTFTVFDPETGKFAPIAC